MPYQRHIISFFIIILCCAAISYGMPLMEEPPSFFYVTTIAGDGRKGDIDGQGRFSRFNWPTGVAVTGDGVVYVADYSNNLIRRIDTEGFVTTLVGSGKPGFKDGMGREALLWGPDNIVMDASGNLYVGDADNFRIRRIAPDGVVTTMAGSKVSGYVDGKGDYARFGYPTGVALDKGGTIYVADRRVHAIRVVTQDGFVKTLAGNGRPGLVDGKGVLAYFDEPISIAVGADGMVYVADSGNNAIRKIAPDGVVTTVAGGGKAGYKDGIGSDALFSWPTGIALDANENIYVCDSNNNKVRRITPKGVVSTIAGGLVAGSADGRGLMSKFNFPTGIAIDRLGNIYVADSGNNSIRKITYAVERKVELPR